MIDFGSFTLDVAVLLLDLGIQDHDKFPVEKIIPVSFEIGVTSGIDRPCFSALFDRHDVNGGLLKQYEKEDAKVELYAGRSYALDSGIILGDTDQDKKTVGSAIDSYCRSVWEHIAPRCHDSEVVILTGGGSCIPYVRDFIHSRLQKRGVKHIVDFGDTGYCDLGVGIHKWRRSGISLGRLGSALGGASIGFGFEPDEGFGRGYIPGR